MKLGAHGWYFISFLFIYLFLIFMADIVRVKAAAGEKCSTNCVAFITGCRKGLSQLGVEFVSVICGLALDQKNKFKRSQVTS